MVDYMSTNPLFAAGEYGGPLGAQRNDAQWQTLANTLSAHGPKKTVAQWKHTWRDLKRKSRNEAAFIRRLSNRTGNKDNVPELSQQSSKVLGAIGQESAYGIMGSDSETGLGGVAHDVVPSSPPQDGLRPLEEAGDAGDTPHVTPPQGPQPSPQSTPQPQQASNAAQFVASQNITNDIFKELVSEMRISNQLRRETNKLLQVIANNRSAAQPPAYGDVDDMF